MDVCILSSFNFTFKPDSFLRSKIMLTITTNTNLNIKWKSQLKSATKKTCCAKTSRKKNSITMPLCSKQLKRNIKNEWTNERTNECVSRNANAKLLLLPSMFVFVLLISLVLLLLFVVALALLCIASASTHVQLNIVHIAFYDYVYWIVYRMWVCIFVVYCAGYACNVYVNLCTNTRTRIHMHHINNIVQCNSIQSRHNSSNDQRMRARTQINKHLLIYTHTRHRFDVLYLFDIYKCSSHSASYKRFLNWYCVCVSQLYVHFHTAAFVSNGGRQSRLTTATVTATAQRIVHIVES